MATEVVGKAPRKTIRVAICPGKDPVEVPSDQMTYFCIEANQTVPTTLMDPSYHAIARLEYQRDQAAESEDLISSSFAPQLHLSREDEEE